MSELHPEEDGSMEMESQMDQEEPMAAATDDIDVVLASIETEAEAQPLQPLPDNAVFHPGNGVFPIRALTRRNRSRQSSVDSEFGPLPATPRNPFETWEERTARAPEPGTLRLLMPPLADAPISIRNLWARDMSYTEWFNLWNTTSTDFELVVYGPTYRDDIRTVFEANQRARARARRVLQQFRERIWSRRPACNVDLIDLEPIPPADQIRLTDTTNRQIYVFHRRDAYNTLLSNICLSDEMLPCPRVPTNPYTNQPLTLAQTIRLCQLLVADYARRGRCPPVLFSAFWAARFNLAQFQQQNASLLAQHAITAYFKEINDDTIYTICDTMVSMIADAGRDCNPILIRRWLGARPLTPLHEEWLEMVRDYTLYMNLHVQVRPSWHSRAYIMGEVRALYGRSRSFHSAPLSQRVQSLRQLATALRPSLPPPPPLLPTVQGILDPVVGLLGLPIGAPTLDVSAGVLDAMSYENALLLIQQALLRG